MNPEAYEAYGNTVLTDFEIAILAYKMTAAREGHGTYTAFLPTKKKTTLLLQLHQLQQ